MVAHLWLISSKQYQPSLSYLFSEKCIILKLTLIVMLILKKIYKIIYPFTNYGLTYYLLAQ